jgi:hypothetical protein
MDFSSIGPIVAGYAKNSLIWMLLIIILTIGIFFIYGWLVRRSKLKYFALEFVRFGNGKVGVNQMKAGLFKSKTFLFGLFDYGNEFVMKTTNNKIIQGAKSTHLHDIFSKKGYILIRSPKDPKILVPISKVEFENLQAVMAIAPGDYRDASIRLVNEAIKETAGWEKLLPYIAVGLVVVMTIINVVVNMQMTNHTTDKVGDILVRGCSNAQNTQPAGTP